MEATELKVVVESLIFVSEEPITERTSVVSVVRRESTSPVMIRS